MEHAHFIQAWKAGKVRVEVHRTKAFHMAGSRPLPHHLALAYTFWCGALVLSLPVAISIGALYSGWVGALILLLVTPALALAANRSATKLMLDLALENPDFYHLAVAEGIIRIQSTT